MRATGVPHQALAEAPPLQPCSHPWGNASAPDLSSEDPQQQRQHVEPPPTVLHTTDGRTVRSSDGLGSEAPAGEASTVGLVGAPQGETLPASPTSMHARQGCRRVAPSPGGGSLQHRPADIATSDVTTHHPAGQPARAGTTRCPTCPQELPLSKLRGTPSRPSAPAMWRAAMAWAARLACTGDRAGR